MTSRSPAEANRLLAIHGADPARWPAPDRALIEAVDPAARAAQARLDQSLAAFESPPLPMHLRTAILAAVRADGQSRRAAWRAALLALWHELGGARVAAPVFALALAAGIGLGSGLMPATGPGDGIDDLLTLALIDDPYLALAPDWSGNVP